MVRSGTSPGLREYCEEKNVHQETILLKQFLQHLQNCDIFRKCAVIKNNIRC